jgi:arylsulfatase
MWIRLAMMVSLFVLETVAVVRGRTPASGRQMNIILLVIDDVRWDSVARGSSALVSTPNLNNLASEGVRFDRAYVTTSICSVSRASILTGQYLSRHKIIRRTDQPSPEATRGAFHSLLRRSGFWTGFVGKWGLSPQLRDDWDFFRAYEGQHWLPLSEGGRIHVTEQNTVDALAFLRTRPRDKPFMLDVSFFAAHAVDNSPEQYMPQEWSAEAYRNKTIPPPLRGSPKYYAALPPFLAREENEGRIRYHWRFDTSSSYQAYMTRYFRLITEVDAAIGEIIRELKTQGAYEDTLIIFTSDNGYFHADRGLADKWYPYDESIHVPMIVCDPRLHRGRRGLRNKATVLNIDIAPTILAAAGIPIPDVVQGEDMSQLYLLGNTVKWRDEFLYEHPVIMSSDRIPSSQAVVGQEWKLVYWPDFNHFQLFNLRLDPGEKDNLAYRPNMLGRRETMKKRLDEWLLIVR